MSPSPSDRQDASPPASDPPPSDRPSSPGPTPSGPPLSSTDPPRRPTPTAPPSRPSDDIGSSWVSGTITRGGDGPCYGMTTDAGRELALYTRADVGLAEGDAVRVRVTLAAFNVDCGSGDLMRLLEVDTG